MFGDYNINPPQKRFVLDVFDKSNDFFLIVHLAPPEGSDWLIIYKF